MDDWSVLNNRLDLLLTLREAYPKLKVTLFAIPYDYTYEQDVAGRIMREKTLAAIKEHLDWMEIVPHGLIHLPREFEKCDYETMKKYVLPSIEEMFKKDGLPYVKGFKAPYWLWNEEVVKVLDEEGWWGAVDRESLSLVKPKKFYVYTHKIDEPFSTSTLDLWKLHGHISPPERNNLERCLANLYKMPADAEFKFASELVEE